MPLPPEIYDRVLDYLHSDKSVLKACALAGRCLLPTCRYHLFRKISLSPADVVAFLEFAEGLPSDLISLVHCLGVCRSAAAGFFRGVPVTPHTKELKQLLHGLTSLRLSEVFWGVLPADQKHVLSGLPSVTHLALDRVSFDTTHSMLAFICSFKALHTISFTNWILQKPQVDLASFLTTAPRLLQPVQVHLDVLNLDQPRSITLMIQWLLEQDPPPRIQIDALRLGPLHDHSWLINPCIQHLLASNNTTVDHLQIKGSRITYGEQSKVEYLRCFTSTLYHQAFQSLSFDLILLSLPPNNTFDHYSWDVVTGILRSVTWCSIQHLSLSFVISEWESITFVDWKEMETILMQPHFDKLSQIRIAVHKIDEEDSGTKLIKFVRNALPSLNLRGLLTFEFCAELDGRYY